MPTPPCLKCGQKTIPIMYGYPSPEMFEAAEAGKIALGGCVIGDDDPDWKCAECDHVWEDET